jgi:predicted nucleotide-binding protein (sugar kinase/HSP70/actin superfamily)
MVFKEDQWEHLYVYAKKLVGDKMAFDEIEKRLFEKTIDVSVVSEIMIQIKKVHYAVKRKQGLIKMGFGSIFLVVGFFITYFNFHSNQSFDIVMYGSSSIGVILVFMGLYDIIG